MKKKRIVCFGDSITQCLNHAEGDRWPGRLAFLLEERFPGRWDVYNKGVSGNTTAMALDRFRTDIYPLLPAVVLIEFGINDAYVYPWCKSARVGLRDYKTNLKEIVRQVRQDQGEPILIVNHSLTLRKDFHVQGNASSIGRNLLPYNQIVRKLAKTKTVRCIDIPRLLKKRQTPSNLMHAADGVHLGSDGNRLYAQICFEDLVEMELSR